MKKLNHMIVFIGLILAGCASVGPLDVMNLTAVPGDAEVRLEWVLPIDQRVEGLKILRKIGGNILNINDPNAEVVYEGSVRTSWVDAELMNGTFYYYRIYTFMSTLSAEGIRFSSEGVDTQAMPFDPDFQPPSDPLSEVINFSVAPSNGRLFLSWILPYDIRIDSVRLMRKLTSGFSGPNDPEADVIFEGLNEQWIDEGLSNGQTYFYAAYTFDAATSSFSDGVFSQGTPQDGPVVVSPVSSVTVVPGNQQNELYWSIPNDPLIAGVRIVRNLTGMFQTVSDGDVIYHQSAGSSFVDSGLSNGVTYFYGFYTYDAEGNFAGPVIGSGTPPGGAATGGVFSGLNGPIADIRQLDNGQFYVWGTSSSQLVRFNSDFQIDSSFNMSSLAYGLDDDDLGRRLPIFLPSGKIIVNGYRGQGGIRLERLNPDGSKDTSFTTTSTYSWGRISAVGMQSDGKILVARKHIGGAANNHRALVRFNADGTGDSGYGLFNYGGTWDVQDFVVQADDKLVVLREIPNSGGSRTVVRVTRNGALDSSFSYDSGSYNVNNKPEGLVQQPDGKILIVFSGWHTEPHRKMIRILEDGQEDPNFSFNFAHHIGWTPTTQNYIHRVILGANQKIYLTGQFGSPPAKKLIRLNSNGTIDNSFDFSPAIPLLPTDHAYSVKEQPDGTIWVSGSFENRVKVLSSTGLELSEPFADAGTLKQPFSMAVQADGKILVAYNSHQGAISSNQYSSLNHRSGIFRLHADGTLDPSFVADTSIFDPGSNGAYGAVRSVVVDNEGKIMVAGRLEALAPNGRKAQIVRLNPDGSRDTSFSWNPASDVWPYGYSDTTVLVKHPINGSIYARVDIFGSTTAIRRFNSSGTTSIVYSCTNKPCETYHFLPNDNMVLGHATSSYNNQFRLINSQSGTELPFNPPYLTPPSGSTLSEKFTFAHQSDGKILVGGDFDRAIRRLLPNGENDSSFNVPTLNNAGFRPTVKQILVQPDGKIIISGNFWGKLLRLHPNGEIDYSWNNGWSGFHGHDSAFGRHNTLLTHPNGRLFVGGWFMRYNHHWVTNLLSLDNNGVL